MFDNIVSTVITWCAAIGIVVFVVFLVKDIVEISKGTGSILKVLGKVFFVILLIGVIYASANYDSFGQSFGNVATDAVNNISDEAGELFQ